MKTIEGDLKDDALAEALTKALSTDPSSLGLAQYHEDGRLASWTRAEVLARAKALADALKKAGVRRKEPIIIIPVFGGERDAALLIASCLLLGCPPLVLPAVGDGLTAHAKLMSQAARITDSRIALIASADKKTIESAVTYVEDTIRDIDAIGLPDLIEGNTFIKEAPRDNLIERCQALQLTSGTTGENRICVWSARSMISGMQGVASGMGLVPGDRLFSFSGLHHTLGLLNILCVGLFGGYPAIFLSPRSFAKDPVTWLKGLEASQATVSVASNFALRQVVNQLTPEKVQTLSLGHVRSIWNSGERVMAACIGAFETALEPAGLKPGTLLANYGLAESTGGATYARHDQPLTMERLDADTLESDGIATVCRPGKRGLEVIGMGRPWAGSWVVVRDRNGHELPDGHVGEIALRTPARLERYLNNNAATQDIFEGDLLVTGDLGYIRNGDLFWVARRKSLIIVRGRNIDPDEFLQVLTDIDGLDPQRYVAFGTAEPTRGTERVILVIELLDAAKEATVVSTIRRKSARMIGIVPDQIIILPPQYIETTISGKRRHAHYRKMFESGGAEAIRAPKTRTV